MKHTGIDSGRQQVVRCRNGMDVASEVEVEVLHWDDLAVAATGGSALDSESRSLTRLPHAGENPLVQMGSNRLAKTNGRGSLALAERSGE